MRAISTAGRARLTFNQPQEPPIFFADLPRFLKRARPFVVEAAELALDVLNVDLEVVPDEISIFLSSLRVTGNETMNARMQVAGFTKEKCGD